MGNRTVPFVSYVLNCAHCAGMINAPPRGHGDFERQTKTPSGLGEHRSVRLMCLHALRLSSYVRIEAIICLLCHENLVTVNTPKKTSTSVLNGTANLHNLTSDSPLKCNSEGKCASRHVKYSIF